MIMFFGLLTAGLGVWFGQLFLLDALHSKKMRFFEISVIFFSFLFFLSAA